MTNIRRQLLLSLGLCLLLACTPKTEVEASQSSAPLASPVKMSQAGGFKLSTHTLASGLDTPWELVFLPDGRLLVTERSGQLRVIQNRHLAAEPLMSAQDFVPPVREQGEGGLLGLVADPQFASNGYAYAAYTTEYQGQAVNRLVRLHEDSAGQWRQQQVLLDVPAGRNHNGGRLAFGPDGKLYWTVGELFEAERAQDLNDLTGKILRLNSDGSIPDDNPFPDSYVYSYGHRNPQGLAWSPDGELYATEHGPSGEKGCCQDELNRILKGANYGWPLISGDERQAGLQAPLLHSGRTTTWAPGGLVWLNQGPWQGSLLFTGLRGQALYRVLLDPQTAQVQRLETYLEGELGRLRTVLQGPDGQIYILTSNRDGRYSGQVPSQDDRVLEVRIEAL